MTVTTRAARREDAYALWLWANDEGTRASSHGRAAISWDDHVAWLGRQSGAGARIFIGETPAGQPVGSIRFDSADGWSTARLSYVIAPESRGRGCSRPMVEHGVAALRQDRPAVAVWADVMADNEPSLRVFRSLGWVEESGLENARRFWLRGSA